LTDLINAALREAHSSNDYVTPTILIGCAFKFYKLEHGAEEFIYVCYEIHFHLTKMMSAEKTEEDAFLEEQQLLGKGVFGSDV
jgi:hypothetical protein